MICFYHKADLDGHCSGAIIKNKFLDCICVGVDHGDTIEKLDQKIKPNEEIYVVDFCFNDEDMDFLNGFKLHWIDHHKSSIDNAHKRGFLANGGQSLEIGKAACELTWEYIHPETSTPWAVYALGRYDVWDHEDFDVLPFQYGMRLNKNTLPESNIWRDYLCAEFNPFSIIENILYENILFKTIKKGKLILSYEEKQNQMYAKGMFFETIFEGLRAVVINRSFANSKIFDSVYNPDKHDLMILFGMKRNSYKYTLYSTKDEVDVSVLAQKYGGGGHKKAAGFLSNKMELF